MKSIDKLKRLTGEDIAPKKAEQAQPIPATSKKQEQLDDLRRRIDSVVNRTVLRGKAAQDDARARGNRGLSEILEGSEIENEQGRFFLVSDVVQGSSRHGHRNIRDAFDFDMSAAAMLANNPAISGYHSSDALFLDTETTGLSGGTGTMAFLIGLGWFEEGHFQVRQLLARDFGEEKAALVYLKEIAAGKKFLVTFNGKAFDVNLLTTRFIMNRMPVIWRDCLIWIYCIRRAAFWGIDWKTADWSRWRLMSWVWSARATFPAGKFPSATSTG